MLSPRKTTRSPSWMRNSPARPIDCEKRIATTRTRIAPTWRRMDLDMPYGFALGQTAQAIFSGEDRLAQCRARALYQIVVAVPGTAQEERARRQIAVAPLRSHRFVIFHHRGTEFVIVRVATF